MDRVTKGFLEEFSSSFELSIKDEATLFETFSNYCALSSEFGDADTCVQNMSTGNSAQGIDGIAIIVNGSMVENPDDIKSLISQNKRLDVKFIFVQAKTENKFDNAEIGNFLTFTERFFSEKANKIFKAEEMLSFIEMSLFRTGIAFVCTHTAGQ